jgi:glucokinase
VELGAKVLGNTASAILQLRDHLNRDTIDRAVALLSAATRVEFYASGQYGVVAEDAQYKFLRFGFSSGAFTNARLQLLAAQVLRPTDVVVVISPSGRVDELLAVADAARARGAAVLAITTSQSPLAKKADLSLIVDHVEDTATQVPMVSRVLHLLMVDILAVGVAMQRGTAAALPAGSSASQDEAPPAPQPPAAHRAGPGISAAGPLAQLTSHSR